MSQEQRRVAVTHKVPLDHVADNWAGAYMVVQLLSFRERVERESEQQQKQLASMSDTEKTDHMLDIAKRQFVSGQIPVFNDKGEPGLAPMKADDIEENEELITAAYLTAIGGTLDPKVTSTAKATSSTPPDLSESSTDESSTKTISSTESSQPIAA